MTTLNDTEMALALFIALTIHVRRCLECKVKFKAVCDIGKELNKQCEEIGESLENYEVIYDKSREMSEIGIE